MRVYHFLTERYGLQNIRQRRLKIATLHDLNDPFELLSIDFSHPGVRRMFEELKDELAKTRGMICFSRDWHNPVQWSHYAERHRGICLGFDIPDIHAVPVRYTGKRLVAEAEALVATRQLDEQMMLRFLSTKYAHWRYESEVRCFVSIEDRDEETGFYFAEFSKDLRLVEAIVGAQSAISRTTLLEALGDLAPQVALLKARLAFRTFRVVRQRKEALWV